MKHLARHFTPKKNSPIIGFTAKQTKLSLQRASLSIEQSKSRNSLSAKRGFKSPLEKEKHAERKAKKQDSDSTGKTISDEIPSELHSHKGLTRGELVWNREGPAMRKALHL